MSDEKNASLVYFIDNNLENELIKYLSENNVIDIFQEINLDHFKKVLNDFSEDAIEKILDFAYKLHELPNWYFEYLSTIKLSAIEMILDKCPDKAVSCFNIINIKMIKVFTARFDKCKYSSKHIFIHNILYTRNIELINELCKCCSHMDNLKRDIASKIFSSINSKHFHKLLSSLNFTFNCEDSSYFFSAALGNSDSNAINYLIKNFNIKISANDLVDFFVCNFEEYCEFISPCDEDIKHINLIIKQYLKTNNIKIYDDE